MKHHLVIALFVIGISLLLNYSPESSSAQKGRSSQRDSKDQELAATIRRLTNRSTAGLVEKRLPGRGGVDLDLQGRFQEVPLAKIDSEGDPAVMCVANLDEANRFYGRNLETGEIYRDGGEEAEHLAAKRAAKHVMTSAEYAFYSEMATKASIAASPNAASILIANGDGIGEGFNDSTAATPEGGNAGTTLGEQRLILFNYAAAIWGSFLDSTVPITVNSKFDPISPCSSAGGVLGSAGTSASRDFAGAQYPGTWYPTALRNKIVGTDNNPAAAEINATFNSSVDIGCLGSGSRFYYGLDNTTPPNRINLLVVLLHEMGHGLGFLTFADGSTGALGNGYIDVFARHMFDRTANKSWGEMTNTERQASAINNGNLLFTGSSVRGASGGLTGGRDSSTGAVQLFAPTSLQSGSSLSHFDKAAFPNLLMEPSITIGLPLSLDLTKQQMRDIGWFRDANGDRIPDSISSISAGAANLLPGSQTSVTWNNTVGFTQNVTIELSIDGGITFPTVLASNIPNTGSFVFTVPDVSTTKGRIRVREYDFNSPSGVSTSDIVIASASNVGIAGQVLTPAGLGLRNAVVYLTDSSGTRISTSTSSMGFFSFPGVALGENITVSVNSRRYRFETRNVLTSATLGPVNFVGIE